MLQLLYPAGLLGVLGILVPLIIHLWNIKSGKSLQIGSISLLSDPAAQRSRNFKITDWPLLLLRCLLILLIAVLITRPFYRSSTMPAGKPGIILLEKESLALVWQQHQNELDSLVKKGYTIRDFNAGFQQLDLKDTAGSFSRPAHRALSYFSLLKQLDTEIPAGSEVYLYTNNQLIRFTGSKPLLHFDLQWKFFEQKQAVIPGAGKDTSSSEILIYENGRSMDSQYLKAAVQSIAGFTGRKILVKEISSFTQIHKSATLVFWLSEQEPTSLQMQTLPKSTAFFTYTGGPKQQVTSFLRDHKGGVLQEAALYQRSAYRGHSANVIWSDGFGYPLLTLDSAHHRKYFQFYSRFNQEWTDLVWSDGLVLALMPLIVPQSDYGFDKTRAAAGIADSVPQLKVLQPQRATLSKVTQSRPLAGVLWWCVLFVLLTERLWSYRKINRSI